MSSDWKESAESDEGIAKIEGVPKSDDGATLSRRELLSFRLVALLLGNKLKEGAALAEEYARAKVAQETSGARRTAEEASNLAAQREELLANADVRRQEATGKFIENLALIGQLPPAQQALAIAKLLQENPEIGDQFAKVEEMIDRLRLLRGVQLSPVEPIGSRELRIEERAASED